MMKVASLPLEDNLPRGGLLPGPRNINWRPNDPATLVWVEALDGGDPRKQVPQRDKVMWIKAPFTGRACGTSANGAALRRNHLGRTCGFRNPARHQQPHSTHANIFLQSHKSHRKRRSWRGI